MPKQSNKAPAGGAPAKGRDVKREIKDLGDINSCHFKGRVKLEPQFRPAKDGGVASMNFLLDLHPVMRGKGLEPKQTNRSYDIRAEVWGPQAVAMNETLAEGDTVELKDVRLENRRYQVKDAEGNLTGEYRDRYVIIVDEFGSIENVSATEQDKAAA